MRSARVVEQFVVGLDLGARLGFFADEALQRGAANSRRAKRQSADNGAPVGFLGQVAWVDRRGVAGPVRFGLDIAARQGPHLPG
ncbi:MAG: hypothetical protein WBX30_16825, partial [Stellaceae bacterium]